MKSTRLNDIALLGCIVCRRAHPEMVLPVANVHHLTGIKYRSTGKKANDQHTIPLCHFHHQGDEGIHTLGPRTWERKYGSQSYLLELVNELLAINKHDAMK